jgi:tight adherence protein C
MPVILIAVLAGLSAVSLAGGGLMLLRRRRDVRIARQRTLALVSDQGPATTAGPEREKLVDSVQKLGQRISGGRSSATLRDQLAAAGWHHPSAPGVYLGAKAALFLLGLAGFGLVTLPFEMGLGVRLCAMMFGAAVLSFVPNSVVNFRRNARRKRVDRHLPDAVDLLEICVSSGMGLDAAWSAVSDEMRGVSDIFADEMELTTLEISLGIQRADALRHMASRTGVEDLSSLVALLMQAERLGASIADALTTFARSLREIRSQRAEEAAEKMSVKLMFPMVLFIFPALLLVMIGPAVIQLVKVMG